MGPGEYEMKNTPGKPKRSYNGFAVQLGPDTELGVAMLIAEDAKGQTRPIGIASTIAEAKEIATHNMHCRTHGNQGDDFLPARYKLWARGIAGEYRLAATLEA
jgi:hypothetical protein